MSSKPSGGSAVFLSQNHLASGDWNAYIIENASGDANQSGVWQPPIDMVFNDGHRLSIAVYRYMEIRIFSISCSNRVFIYCSFILLASS